MGFRGDLLRVLAGIEPEYPACMNCGQRNYRFVTKPTFTVDRFSRARISCFVDCSNCGLRHRMSQGPGEAWTHLMPG